MEFKLIDFIIYILNLIVLFLILRAVLYKPVKNFMKTREEKLSKQREDAKLALEDAQSDKKRYGELLENARVEADSVIEKSRGTADSAAADILRKAEAEAKRIVEDARVRAEAERAEALKSLEGEAAAISLELASKILAREVSAEDNKRIIDEYFSKVG